mmetsp:Transcript_55063/g.128844  ORF Transcript_55063/g.128844 Transcript_55063/m.128844 type:complete len:524 (+) Transcript_55063:22-1593(+)
MAPQLSIQVSADASAEHVVLCGSHEALGNWNPERGVELQWQYNAWVTKEPISLPCTQIEFKFVRLSERGHVEWESGKNRVLELPAPSGKKKTMQLRSKFNGDSVLSPEVVPNKEALAAERAAVRAAADAALAVEIEERNHQLKLEQGRDAFRRKLEDRKKIISELQQGLEAARREVSELSLEEAQLVRDVQDASARRLRALSRTFIEVGHTRDTGVEKARSATNYCDLSQVESPTTLPGLLAITGSGFTEPKGSELKGEDLHKLKETLFSALGPHNSNWDDASTTCSGLDTASQASSKHGMESTYSGSRHPQDGCLTPTRLRKSGHQPQDTESPVKMPFRGTIAKTSAFSRGNCTAPLSSLSNVMKSKREPPLHEVFFKDWEQDVPIQVPTTETKRAGMKAAVSLPDAALPEKQLRERALRTLSRSAEAPSAGMAPQTAIFDIAVTPEELGGKAVSKAREASGMSGLAASQGLLSALQSASDKVHAESIASIEASYWGRERRKWANAITVGRTDQSSRAWTHS